MSSFNNGADTTLIFIPDISGYTKFVNSTEILHAKHILEELLEVLIDANEIGLKLSEIEGDALLFYRKGKAPTVTEMLVQIQKMFTKFHLHLKKLESHRICSCGACSSANELTIKFVAHYGEVAENQVKDRFVLFGKEVITAHRLLKNNIDSNAYGLFSHQLLDACPTWKNLPNEAWSEVVHQEEEYDFGKANYCSIDLTPLLDQVSEPKPEDYSIRGATQKLLEIEHKIEAPINLVFNVFSDYSFRHEFFHGLLDSDKLNHKITQNGSSHRCVIKKDESDPFFISHDYSFGKNKITFVESSHKNKFTSIYTLTAIEKNLTRLEMMVFTIPNILKLLLFRLFIKKKIIKSTAQTFINLNAYCKKLLSKNQPHPSQIVLPKEVFEMDEPI